MIRKLIIIIVSLFMLLGAFLVLRTVPMIKQSIDNYAIEKMTDKYGKAKLNPELEAHVLAIAQEMGITESIVVRKMNSAALQTMGYYNAFVDWATFFTIPYSNQAFMFVSEGFFEDLSIEEQRFLIGHELIHIRERHGMFLDLFTRIGLLILLLLGFYLINFFFKDRFAENKISIGLILFFLLYISFAVPNLIQLSYRRYIEKMADCESFRLLSSYDGCLKLLKRWRSDFGMI